jgi:hydrogenase maturation protease
MDSEPARPVAVRVLSLGNDLLADDGFGFAVAQELKGQIREDVEIICSPAAGLALLDTLEGATHLLVVDTWQAGTGIPGTVYRAEEATFASARGPSLHSAGLMETLALGRRLQMSVPKVVAVVAVEPADCLTVGGPMTPAVRRAVPTAAALARRIVDEWLQAPPAA